MKNGLYARVRQLWAHLSCRYSTSGSLRPSSSADTKDALFLFAAWLRSETKANGMTAPTTSTTLLRDIASSAENARWGEFFSRYEPRFARQARRTVRLGFRLTHHFMLVSKMPNYRHKIAIYVSYKIPIDFCE